MPLLNGLRFAAVACAAVQTASAIGQSFDKLVHAGHPVACQEAQPLALREAHPDTGAGLQVPADLALDQVLCDPVVANPLYLNFDARGRLWVVQFRQYPWPAGLQLISRDNVWRT